MANVLRSGLRWISGFLNLKATGGGKPLTDFPAVGDVADCALDPGPCGPKGLVELTRLCLERAQEMMLSRRAEKLNFKQCKYLAKKLKLAIESADTFSELLKDDYSYVNPSLEDGKDINRLGSFKLLYGLAKEVENFIGRCCTGKWIQSALNLINVMQHVLSLGFDLQLWTLLYSDIKREWTQEEVDGFFKAEAETVQQKALLDRGTLLRELNAVLQAQGSTETDRQLAAYVKGLIGSFERARPVVASDAPQLPDSRLFETVKLREQIGEGAVAKVFKVEWRGSELAMKKFDGPNNPSFEKEVSGLIGLFHPNIVSLMGCREDKNSCSIFMELLDKSLRSLIDERLRDGSLGRHAPFDILEAVDIMLQIGEGMRYVHEMKIVHRDLKSENILVRCLRDPELGIESVAAAKVSSFELSKIRESSVSYSNQTLKVGTTRWMAPEMLQCFGESGEMKYPFKCDIYSFALVCYETLTGHLPFSSISRAREVQNMVLTGSRPELPEGCPSPLKDLIERCWDQDASQRPSFCEICVELRNLKCSLMMPSIQMAKVSHALYNPVQPSTKGATPEETESGGMANKSSIGDWGFLVPSGPCTPEWYLELTRTSMAHVETMTAPKFNIEQCKYLAAKLKLAVESANSFLDLLNKAQFIPSYEEDKEICLEKNFRLLFALAMKVENFIKSCFTDRWIQSAFTLTNMAEHVSSLSFDLKLWTLLYSDIKPSRAGRSWRWTEEEVDRLFKTEAETVEEKASLDREILLGDLNSVLRAPNSTNTDRQLAAYMKDLLERYEISKTRCGRKGLFEANELPKVSDSRLFDIVTPMAQIGKGSFGTVFGAKWLGSELAMKTFPGPDNPFFEKEVSVLIGLSHPNIVSLMGYKSDQRHSSIFMELLDKSLRSLIDERLRDGRDTPFGISEAVDIMLQIGEGMCYVHEMRIVHRDLKSDNILVRCLRKPELHIELVVAAKVADFGLSRTKEKSITYSNQTLNQGTSRWIAPEMIKSSIAGNEKGKAEGELMVLQYPFKSDMYSFAMVCYEILTGNQPFHGTHEPKRVKDRVLNGDRPELPEGCPLLLENLIERCWSQHPSKRPSFCEICVELRHLKCYLLMPSILEKVSPPLKNRMQMSARHDNAA